MYIYRYKILFSCGLIDFSTVPCPPVPFGALRNAGENALND